MSFLSERYLSLSYYDADREVYLTTRVGDKVGLLHCPLTEP